MGKGVELDDWSKWNRNSIVGIVGARKKHMYASNWMLWSTISFRYLVHPPIYPLVRNSMVDSSGVTRQWACGSWMLSPIILHLSKWYPNRHQQRLQSQSFKWINCSCIYMKKQLAWFLEKGADNTDLLGSISPLSLVLIGKESPPHKANRSSVTQYLRKRYSKMPIVMIGFCISGHV